MRCVPISLLRRTTAFFEYYLSNTRKLTAKELYRF